MTFKDIVSQMLERGNAMQTFWGFYISVSIGLIAFFGNAKRTKRLPVLAIILSLAFVAFAVVNCGGMTDIAAQRHVFYDRLDRASQADEQSSDGKNPSLRATLNHEIAANLKSAGEPPTPGEVMGFHVAADVLVLAAVWTLTLWKDSNKTPAERKVEFIKEITEVA